MGRGSAGVQTEGVNPGFCAPLPLRRARFFSTQPHSGLSQRGVSLQGPQPCPGPRLLRWGTPVPAAPALSGRVSPVFSAPRPAPRPYAGQLAGFSTCLPFPTLSKESPENQSRGRSTGPDH